MIAPLLAAAEERWIVPAYSSRHAGAWITAHKWLTLPFRLRGEVRRYDWSSMGRPLTVVTIGAPRRLRRFCERLVGPLADAPGEGRQVVWAPAPLAAANADLVVAEIHQWAAARFRRDGWQIVPSVVRWRGELALVPPPCPSRSLRDDLRKVRQHHYELRRADTDADWEEFYTTMVVPQAERRFGEAAWIPSLGFLRALRKVAVLQFICRGKERLGGFCIVPNGDCVWFPLLGALAGDESLRREGVLAAVYVLGIGWAKAHGYRRIDKGRTSGFINDGVAAYKRKWGLEPVSDPLSHLFAVKISSDPAVTEVFAREPVLIETDTGLAEFTGAAP